MPGSNERRSFARVCALLAAVLAASGAAPAPAEESADGPDELGTFTFTLDNDLFGGSDRYYTNGVRLAWRSPA